MTNSLLVPASRLAGRVSHATALCVVVALNGLIEAVSGWLDLSLVGDIAGTPDLSPAGWAALAPMVLHLSLGVAAFCLAASKRLRLGLAALALCVLAKWAGYTPVLLRNALDLSAGVRASDVAVVLFKAFGQPLVCVGALVAAWRGRALAPATFAMAVSTIIDHAEVAMFALAVTLYGV